MRGFQSKQGVQPDMAYATCSDFCENFVADVQPLYLLAFLLEATPTRNSVLLLRSTRL
jgi:hypothetical protein